MAENSHIKLMHDCDKQLTKVGVAQKGGKKYMMVKDRMTLFRQCYGLTYGITTALLHSDENTVCVHAQVIDKEGNIVGSGLAEEQRGGNHVNKASALENCESSAVGRALASLGLHGGEYPTLDEMESDKRSRKIIDERIQSDLDVLLAKVSKCMGNSALQVLWESTAAMRHPDNAAKFSESQINVLVTAINERKTAFLNGSPDDRPI